MNKYTLRVSPKEMEEIITAAAIEYAQYDNSICLKDLIKAGNSADIPDRFIHAAYQEALDRRQQPKTQKRKTNRLTIALILASSLFSIKFNSVIFNKLSPYIPTFKSVSDIPPKPYIPPDVLHVESIESWRRRVYDGNPIYEMTVYQEGKTGHVTELTCILPPNVKAENVEMFTKGKKVDDKVYFCTPVDNILPR